MDHKRTSRRQVQWVLLGAVFVVAGLWALTRPPKSAEMPASSVAAQATVSRVAERDSDVGSDDVRALFSDEVREKMGLPTEPLPPLDMPLAQALDELERRVREGDRAAACRLAVERQTCASMENDLIVHDRWLASREQVFQKGITDNSFVTAEQIRNSFEMELEGREKGVAWKRQHCEEVPPIDGKALVEDWRRAAKLGSWPAMRDYAGGAAFEWSHLLANAEQLARYRGEAGSMALVVAGWGDVAINLTLAEAYSPFKQGDTADSLLRQAVKPNAAMSLAMYKRLEREMAAVDTQSRLWNESSSVALRARSEIAYLESRLSDAERAHANEVMKMLDKQWQPPNRGLWKGAQLFPGQLMQRSPRHACGATRDS